MYFEAHDFDVVDRVVALANQHGATPAQIALVWLLHKPGVTAPIVGASKMHHLEQAVGAVEIVLSAEEIAYIEEPYQPHPVLGNLS